MLKNIPVLGIDDAGFNLFDYSISTVPIFGVIMKGGITVEGIIQTEIEKDDPNPTDKVIEMVKRSNHIQHIQCILFEGITIGGFGILDIKQIYSELGIPVVVSTRNKPDLEQIKKALMKNFEDWENRWNLITNIGPPLFLSDLDIFYQYEGIDEKQAVDILQITTVNGKLPEPVRIAHLIGASYYENTITKHQ